jgi:tripartite-type tricarboxylate transporter receptor subunit TctC
MVLPQPPGGAVDTISRSLGIRLTELLSQPIVVDNRPGANGILAAETVAKAPPDGYTLLMAVDTNLVVNPNLYAKVSYDPFRDFAPIGVVAKVGLALVLHPAVPAGSVRELIALAKSRPGELNYASIGYGTQQHLGMELFKSMAGINLTHVPYKGTAAAVTEVLAGRTALMFTGMPSALANAKAGKLKVLAVTTAQRSAFAPDLPTMAEAGVPGFELYAWFGLLAPAKTPEPVIERLSKAVSESVAYPAFRKILTAQGIEPLGGTPAMMTALMKSDTEKWAKVIRESGAKVE